MECRKCLDLPFCFPSSCLEVSGMLLFVCACTCFAGISPCTTCLPSLALPFKPALLGSNSFASFHPSGPLTRFDAFPTPFPCPSTYPRLFIYLFIGCIGLNCGTRDLSVQHRLFVAVRGLLSSCGVRGRGLISCGTWAL